MNRRPAASGGRAGCPAGAAQAPVVIVAWRLPVGPRSCRSSTRQFGAQFQRAHGQRAHPRAVRELRRRQHLQPAGLHRPRASSTRSRCPRPRSSRSVSPRRPSPANASAGRSRCSSRGPSRDGSCTRPCWSRRSCSSGSSSRPARSGRSSVRPRAASSTRSTSASYPLVWLNGCAPVRGVRLDRPRGVRLVRSPGAGARDHAGRDVVSYFLQILGSLWPDAELLQPYSLFHYLDPQAVLMGEVDPFAFGILAAVAIARRRRSHSSSSRAGTSPPRAESRAAARPLRRRGRTTTTGRPWRLTPDASWTGFGIEALPPATQEQPDEPGQVLGRLSPPGARSHRGKAVRRGSPRRRPGRFEGPGRAR